MVFKCQNLSSFALESLVSARGCRRSSLASENSRTGYPFLNLLFTLLGFISLRRPPTVRKLQDSLTSHGFQDTAEKKEYYSFRMQSCPHPISITSEDSKRKKRVDEVSAPPRQFGPLI
uniref:Uncharacterized protein n=1 Tax=Angiostrongylus cantonensis TaxID=6313 RepID=A0A0K0D8V1_ANGCA